MFCQISCVAAAGVGPAAGPAGWGLSATAHQTAASHPDTTDWDHLSSGRTGGAASLLNQNFTYFTFKGPR